MKGDSRYEIHRELKVPPGHGRQWLISEKGVHESYWPVLTIMVPYDVDSGNLARAAIAGWNKWDKEKAS